MTNWLIEYSGNTVADRVRVTSCEGDPALEISKYEIQCAY